MEDKSELIACIETGNFAKAARIAAGELACFSRLLCAITSLMELFPHKP